MQYLRRRILECEALPEEERKAAQLAVFASPPNYANIAELMPMLPGAAWKFIHYMEAVLGPASAPGGLAIPHIPNDVIEDGLQWAAEDLLDLWQCLDFNPMWGKDPQLRPLMLPMVAFGQKFVEILDRAGFETIDVIAYDGSTRVWRRPPATPEKKVDFAGTLRREDPEAIRQLLLLIPEVVVSAAGPRTPPAGDMGGGPPAPPRPWPRTS